MLLIMQGGMHMIILNDNSRTWLGEFSLLKDMDQIIGGQTWLIDYPLCITARCRENRSDKCIFISSHESGNLGIPPFMYFRKDIENFLSPEYVSENSDNDSSFLRKLQYGFSLKHLSSIISPELHNDEFQILINGGFLGLLKHRSPELQNDEAFLFLEKFTNTLEQIELDFYGKSTDDIVANIREHVNDKDEPNPKVWEALEDLFQSPRYIEERQSEMNMRFLDMKRNEIAQNNTIEKSTPRKSIEDIISDYLKDYADGKLSTLQEFFDWTMLDGLKSVDDLIEFGDIESDGGYKYNGSLMDDVMNLYFKIKEAISEEHSSAEIAEAVSDVPKSLVDDTLKTIVKDTEKTKEDNPSIGE